jgi:threonine synthase
MRKRPPVKSDSLDDSKIVKKIEPINKLPPKKVVITKNGIEYLDVKPEEAKKKDNNKYLKMPITEPSGSFKEVGERVARKELKWAYYTTENNVGVHYYLILNT